MSSRFDKLLPPKNEPKAEAPESGKTESTEMQEITVRRERGKRSKGDYTQVSAYIPISTHKKVKVALIDDDRDFSELVSDLLADWLRNRPVE
jgi:hypothetical protein